MGQQKWGTSFLFILYISIRLFKTLALKASSLGNMLPVVARPSSKASSTLGSTTTSYFFSRRPRQPSEHEFWSWCGPEFSKFRRVSDMSMLSGASSADVATERFLFEDTSHVEDIEPGGGDWGSPYAVLSGSDTADHSQYALGLGRDEEPFPKPLRRPFSDLHLDVRGEISGRHDALADTAELQSKIHPEAELKEEDEAPHEEIAECEKIKKTELERRVFEQTAQRVQLQKSMTTVQLWGDFFLSSKSMLAITALDAVDLQKAAFKVFGDELSAVDVEWVQKKICEARRQMTMVQKRNARKKRLEENNLDFHVEIMWCKAFKAARNVLQKAQVKKELQEQVLYSRENTLVREWGIWLLENKTNNFVKNFAVQNLRDAATYTFGRVPYNTSAYHELGKEIIARQFKMLWQKKRVDAKKSVAAKKIRSHAAAVAAAAKKIRSHAAAVAAAASFRNT